MAKVPRKSDYSATPTTFYLGSLDSYVRGHVKSDQAYFSAPDFPLDQPAGKAILDEALLDVAEGLMLGDGIALTITGENTILPYLVRAFGAHETAEMIRRGWIEFVGEPKTPGISEGGQATYSDGTTVPPGSPIFATFQWDNAEKDVFPDGRIDGAIAAEKALRRFQSQLAIDAKEIRELVARSAKHTRAVPAQRAAEIIDRIGKAYDDGSLESLGLSPKIARDSNTYHDGALGRLAISLFLTENLLDFELDQFQMPDQWSSMRQFTAQVTAGQRVFRAVDRIMDYRRSPDLRALFRDGVLKMRDIPNLRIDPATKHFRSWLWSQPDPADAEAIATDFVGEVSSLKKVSAANYIKNGFTTVAVAIAQDVLLEPAHLAFGVHTALDGTIALSGFIATALADKFRRRPPSAFFDRIVDPAIEAAKVREVG